MKIAVVVQRYGADINGGAELHARYLAEHLARHVQVEVLTTCAKDYITWSDAYPAGVANVGAIPVRRFPVARPRDPQTFGSWSERVFGLRHSVNDELAWLDAEGPASPELVGYIADHQAEYDYFLFFSFRYYHAFHGARAVPGKAILVPTAERDEALGMGLFPALLRGVRACMYNSPEERALLQAVAGTDAVPGVVVGIGSEVPASSSPSRFRQRTGIVGPTAIYIGRIDENKGCAELFDYWKRYSEITPGGMTLVLVGTPVLPVPDHPRIRHLGFVSDPEKYDALAAAEFLIMPSYLESLSMVALEAWALGKPVLANGKCDVLRGQAMRSNAGLYYENYAEFVEAVRVLESSMTVSSALGRNGSAFFRANYTWPVIERKYLDMFDRLTRQAGEGVAAQAMAPLPGWWARRQKTLPPAREVLAGLPSGPAQPARVTRSAATPPDAGPPLRDDGRARTGRSNEGRSNEGRPNEGRSNESRSNEGRPNEGRPNDGRSQNGRTRDGRSHDPRSRDGQPRDGQSRDSRPRESQSREGRPREAQSREGRPGRPPGTQSGDVPGQSQRGAPAGLARDSRLEPGPALAPAGRATATEGRSLVPPAVHQVLATLGYGDAIGHEVLGIQRVLRQAGFESEVFVETADRRLEDLTVDYRDLADASHPDNLLIHHFSIGSRASRVAYALPDRMALVYHNITPPEFFVDVHPLLVQLCFLGRRELGVYANRVELALGDSEYNREELEALGFPRTAVLPVVPDFTHLDGEPNYMQAGVFDDGWVNLLFVGRMIPNKRIEDVIRAFHAYKRWFNPRSRLLLVGSHGGFERYMAMLHEFVARIGAADVHLLGHVSNEELVAYYEIADVFLCASEHEGFCVPLMEAFHMGVPVLAYAATAVPATMDGGGILYHRKDPIEIAALVDAVVSDATLREAVIDRQDAALDRLLARDFGGLLLGYVDEALRAPRRPVPPVAFDFWDQVRQAEALEEIRMYRPAAFQALPKEQGSGTGDQGPGKDDWPGTENQTPGEAGAR